MSRKKGGMKRRLNILTKLRDLGLALISRLVETDAPEGVNDSKQKGET